MKHLYLNCKTAEMVRAKKDTVIEYRGQQAKVKAVDGWHSPQCGEIKFAGKEGQRYAAALEKLCSKVDAAEAEELARIRKKDGIFQRNTAELTGGGVNALSRYANGNAKPVQAVINLFRLLDKHPELIVEIAG